MLVAGATTQAVVLIVELVGANKALNRADALLSFGALVWLNTIIAFTFLYWEIHGGGPVARASRGAKYPLAFARHMNPDLAPPRLAAAVPRLPLPWPDRRHRVQPDRNARNERKRPIVKRQTNSFALQGVPGSGRSIGLV